MSGFIEILTRFYGLLNETGTLSTFFYGAAADSTGIDDRYDYFYGLGNVSEY